MTDETGTTTYEVAGMTCGHCVASVTKASEGVPGVAHVNVDLDAGTAAVTGTDVDPDAVRAAIRDAGYEVT